MRGADWRPLNAGCAADFLPEPDPQYGHDPHCVIDASAQPDRLYQQNHCGIYRLDRPGERWSRIGDAMPRRIGDIGFPIVLHPTDPDRAWVFPMDGTTVWPRTSVDGKPAVYAPAMAASPGGVSTAACRASRAGSPCLRQAMCADDEAKNLGLYFGTTQGRSGRAATKARPGSASRDTCPEVFSVTWATEQREVG